MSLNPDWIFYLQYYKYVRNWKKTKVSILAQDASEHVEILYVTLKKE